MVALINAAIALHHQAYSEALRWLKIPEPYELGGAGTFINYMYPAYLRGESYLMEGNGRAAGGEYKKLLDHSGIVVNFVTGSLSRLQIGRARKIARPGRSGKRLSGVCRVVAKCGQRRSDSPAGEDRVCEIALIDRLARCLVICSPPNKVGPRCGTRCV